MGTPCLNPNDCNFTIGRVAVWPATSARTWLRNACIESPELSILNVAIFELVLNGRFHAGLLLLNECAHCLLKVGVAVLFR